MIFLGSEINELSQSREKRDIQGSRWETRKCNMKEIRQEMEFQQEVNSISFYRESINMIFKWMKWADPFESLYWNTIETCLTQHHFWKS